MKQASLSFPAAPFEACTKTLNRSVNERLRRDFEARRVKGRVGCGDRVGRGAGASIIYIYTHTYTQHRPTVDEHAPAECTMDLKARLLF